ncbi:hypothetical protein J4Q44_G00018030 [Coregonus suidteri]|uniref:Ig-like domain-containing protein n=1 Tax=Coregonus suidteri TaxID=861788 RepID=A0AAN8M8K6_9TELE
MKRSVDVMETRHILVWRICLILALLPHPHQCLSVYFQNQGSLYVALGRDLVLLTQFQITPTEKILMVTWDRETEKGQGKTRWGTRNQQIYLLERVLLLLWRLCRSCVRWPMTGHSGTSPVFSWLVDGVEVSNQTANLSTDGRRLYVSGMKGHNYTCVVNSSLGTSVTYYITG